VRQSTRLSLEPLEARNLLSPITEFPIPTGNSAPAGIATGSDGNLWFAEERANQIGRITPAGTVTGEFKIHTAGSQPYGLAAGPDGNLWFTEFIGNNIGRITTSGSITEFALSPGDSHPTDITSGPDGNMWFTEIGGKNDIGRITPSGSITEFHISDSDIALNGITAGPDGNLWFTEYNGNKIGRLTPSGSLTEFSVPNPSSQLSEITSGPDGNLWFTEEAGRIGRITTAGAVTEYAVPAGYDAPYGITTGPDGNLWFTQFAGYYQGNKIGRLTPDGQHYTNFTTPTTQSQPLFITTGPDGNLWFTEFSANQIGQLNLSALNVTLGGRTFNDLNGSGVDDPSNPGLSGWTVDLYDTNGNLVDSKVTDSNGNYSFTEAPGTYTIQEVLPGGWTQTYPASPGTYTVTLSGGQSSTGDDFGNFQLVTVGGTVFFDKNDNRVLDPGEPGIGGVTIYLDGVSAATSDSNGNFSISGVGPGAHTLSEGVPTGYILTSPTGNSFAFTPTSGTGVVENFANDKPTKTIDNGQSGYSTVGPGWTTINTGWNGTSQTHARAKYTTYAEWYFGHLGGKETELFVTWGPDLSRSTAAVYRIFNNSKLIGTVAVDQTRSPTDAFYAGVYWKSLGVFNIQGLRDTYLQLYANNNGTVDADGALALRVGNTGTPDGLLVATGNSGAPLMQPVLQSMVAALASLNRTTASTNGLVSSAAITGSPSSGSAPPAAAVSAGLCHGLNLGAVDVGFYSARHNAMSLEELIESVARGLVG
jgi:streptogramin lyase